MREYDDGELYIIIHLIICPGCNCLTDEEVLCENYYANKPVVYCHSCKSGYVIDLPVPITENDLQELKCVDKEEFISQYCENGFVTCNLPSESVATVLDMIRLPSDDKAEFMKQHSEIFDNVLNLRCPECTIYEVNLLYITRIVPSCLTDFIAHRKLNMGEMEKLAKYEEYTEGDVSEDLSETENSCEHSNEEPECVELKDCPVDGITLYDYSIIDDRRWNEFQYNFNMSVPCESYDIYHPKESYPEWVYMDGEYIFIEYVETDGRLGHMCICNASF